MIKLPRTIFFVLLLNIQNGPSKKMSYKIGMKYLLDTVFKYFVPKYLKQTFQKSHMKLGHHI